MSGVVEASKPGFGVRMARWGIPLIFAATQLFRRPPRSPRSVSVHRYGEHPDENLEWIEARVDAPRRAPIVYIHGGGWIAGRKELYTRYLSFLADAGYPIFNLEYPMAPENPHPGILRSLLKALDWIRECQSERRPTRLLLLGDLRHPGGDPSTLQQLRTQAASGESDPPVHHARAPRQAPHHSRIGG